MDSLTRPKTRFGGRETEVRKLSYVTDTEKGRENVKGNKKKRPKTLERIQLLIFPKEKLGHTPESVNQPAPTPHPNHPPLEQYTRISVVAADSPFRGRPHDPPEIPPLE